MARKGVAVLDFGSSKITVLVGMRSVNHNYTILSSGQADYAGFMDGEFLEPNTLKYAIESSVKKAEEGLRDKIKSLFVGVPSEFCKLSETDLEINFGKRTLITRKHIDELFTKCQGIKDPSSVIISMSPMYYVLDDGNKTNSCVGSYSTSVRAHVSLVFVENKFVHMINSIMHDIGNIECEFVCSTLAEGVYLLDQDERNTSTILIDCGYISTSVSHMVGEGLADLQSFSQGGGFITADLAEALELTFADAEQLKRKLILSIQATGIDYYEIYGDDQVFKIPAKDANNIVLGRVDAMVEYINDCIANFDNPVEDDAPVYLTGGGLSYLKGIKNYLTKALNRPVTIVKPRALQYRNPELSSVISLLDFALSSN